MCDICNIRHTGTVHKEEAIGTASLTEIVKAAASMTGGRVPNGVTVTSTGTEVLLKSHTYKISNFEIAHFCIQFSVIYHHFVLLLSMQAIYMSTVTVISRRTGIGKWSMVGGEYGNQGKGKESVKENKVKNNV